MPMKQSRLLGERIIRTVTGPMWHGPAIAELLGDVTHEQAAQRPVATAHTIWELVLHIIAWVDISGERLGGVARNDVSRDEDWPRTPTPSAAAWSAAVVRLEERHRSLADRVAALTDDALEERPAGHDYSIGDMLQGVVEHATYHGGQ